MASMSNGGPLDLTSISTDVVPASGQTSLSFGSATKPWSSAHSKSFKVYDENNVLIGTWDSTGFSTDTKITSTSQALTATTNQQVIGATAGNKITNTYPAPAANRTYTIPDAGA